MIQDSMAKTIIVLGFWVITVPSIFSIITSLVAAVYFASMLKFNVVDKQYHGSWRLYLKSILKHLISKRNEKKS